jgi:hypothetical protein
MVPLSAWLWDLLLFPVAEFLAFSNLIEVGTIATENTVSLLIIIIVQEILLLTTGRFATNHHL